MRAPRYSIVYHSAAAASDAAVLPPAEPEAPHRWRVVCGALAAAALLGVAGTCLGSSRAVRAARFAGSQNVIALAAESTDWCGGPDDECTGSQCCQDGGPSGYQCYAKNDYWAQCLAACENSEHEHDKGEWSCKKRGDRSRKGCDYLNGKQECEKENDRCFWGQKDAESGICQQKCFSVKSDGACNRQSHCTWHEDACKPACSTYGQENCAVDRCTWRDKQCKPACWTMSDADFCESNTWDQGCIWQGGQCIVDPDATGSGSSPTTSTLDFFQQWDATTSTTTPTSAISTMTSTPSGAVYVELVASVSCRDDFAWVDEVNCTDTSVYLYSGCRPDEPRGNRLVSGLVPLPPCAHVELLPNATKAGAAYLYHLMARRERLAESGDQLGALVFLPQNPKWTRGPVDAAEHARRWVAAGVGFATLSYAACAADGLQETCRNLTHNLFNFLTGRDDTSNWVVGYEDQFFVSTRREGGVRAWLYDYFLDLLFSDALLGEGSRQWRAPAMERLWGPLFGCWASFPLPLRRLPGTYPACKDDCDGGHSCGPNHPLVPHGAVAPQGKREWAQSMLAPANHSFRASGPLYSSSRAAHSHIMANHTLSVCTGRARLYSQGYDSSKESSGFLRPWSSKESCEPAPAGPVFCGVGFLLDGLPELSANSDVNPSDVPEEARDGHHQPSQHHSESAGLDADLAPYFLHVGLRKACSNWHDIQLGSPSTEGSIQTCGKMCMMYSECSGFSWQEATQKCTLLTGAPSAYQNCISWDGLVQLYAKSVAPAPIEVVLSGYCHDNYNWIREVDCADASVFLYTKCDGANPVRNIPARLPPCVQLELLLNIGREGATFFYHLHVHRERFASGTAGNLVFLQGEVEWHKGPKDLLRSVRQWASAGFGFVPLAWASYNDRGPFKGGGCDPSCWYSRTVQLHNLVKFFTRQSEYQTYVAGFRGQMLVSKKRAARVPAWVFEYSLALLASEETSRSWYGMAFERLWNLIFGCWAQILIRTTEPEEFLNHSLNLSDFPACLDDCDLPGGLQFDVSKCGPNKPVAWEGLRAPMGKQEWVDAMLADNETEPVPSHMLLGSEEVVEMPELGTFSGLLSPLT